MPESLKAGRLEGRSEVGQSSETTISKSENLISEMSSDARHHPEFFPRFAKKSLRR